MRLTFLTKSGLPSVVSQPIITASQVELLEPTLTSSCFFHSFNLVGFKLKEASPASNDFFSFSFGGTEFEPGTSHLQIRCFFHLGYLQSLKQLGPLHTSCFCCLCGH